MSYILDAIKKAEYERDIAQFVDFKSNSPKQPHRSNWINFILAPSQTYAWLCLGVMLLMNVLIFGRLFWHNEPLTPPQVHIMSSTTLKSIALNQSLKRLPAASHEERW